MADPASNLLQQGKHRLRLLVGLRQHGCGSLLNDLRFSQVRRRRCVVGVHDTATRGRCILHNVGQVIQGIRQLIDTGAERRALKVNRITG